MGTFGLQGALLVSDLAWIDNPGLGPQDLNDTNLLNGNVFEVMVGNSSFQNLTEYMNLTINHKEKMLNNCSHRCVSLSENEDDNITGHWDSAGCKTTVHDNQTICQCNHLSYFAVLLDFREKNTLDENVLISLMYISQIGCGFSAIFSAVTIILYCAFRERARHPPRMEHSAQRHQKETAMFPYTSIILVHTNTRLSSFPFLSFHHPDLPNSMPISMWLKKIKSDQVTKIHMNLCTALFLLNVNFLTNVWLSMVRNDGFCKTIAVCLHYSLLCTFTWIGIEAFQLYLMLIKVFNTYISHYLQKLALIGWGIPAVVVFVCIGADKDNYGLFVTETQDKNNTVSMCWITNNVVHYVTNCGYFSIICFGNTAMLITACAKLMHLQRGSSTEQGSVWKDLWTVLGLYCLLSTAWALVFFSFGPLHVIQIYLFSIFNSLHG
ncbi:adhesion G-protein coupled receptor G2-like [Cetorhinus maximus]